MLGTRKPGLRDLKSERQRLLGELEELERARQRSEIGPKTYERARRELLDAIARTFAVAEPSPERPRRKRPRAAA